METRQFELSDGKSDKFWRITLDGSSSVVNFGRRGTAGQTQTKDYGSGDAARKAYEKLIEEKVKKGYSEVTANGVVALVATQPKQTMAAPAPPAVEKPVEKVSRPPIDIDPTDWNWATWRPRIQKERPAAPAFTAESGLKRLEQIVDRMNWSMSWDKAPLPISMTREEARFWVEAMARVHQLKLLDLQAGASFRIEDVMRVVGRADWAAPFSVDDAVALLSPSNVPVAILLPLYHLFSWDELMTLLHRLPKQLGGSSIVMDGVFRTSMYEYLSEQELHSLREAVREWLVDVVWPAWGNPSWVLWLAGQIGGLHKELETVLDAMPAPSYPAIYPSYLFSAVFGLNNPQDVIEHAKRRQLVLNRPEYVAGWLAHTELSALDWVVESMNVLSKSQGASSMKAFVRMVNAAEAAPAMLALLDSKNPAPAKEWLDSHPRETFHGLLPLLSSTAKQTAERAVEFIRTAGAQIDETEREAAYAGLSDAARRKLTAGVHSAAGTVVDEIPVGLREAFEYAVKQKMKAPAWITAANVPPILIKDGRLPEEYVAVLLAALKHGDPRIQHPFVLAMRCYALPDSLDAFAAAVFEQWRSLGMESREKWALFALGAFGSDRCALQLAPYVRNWPGESKNQAAILGLEVLRNIGTDTAILQINSIAQKTKFAALKKRAQESMEEVATDRGLSRDELEDRIVPDCGLDERGTRQFDYGPRQFELRIGEGLKPVVVGPDGVRKPNLPPPNAKDDPEKSKAAMDEWKMVKKQVADVAKTQVIRLEQALVTQRRWPKEDFELLLVAHPMMTNLVRLLVWGVYSDGRLDGSFRVAEDRTYTNARDEAVELPEEGVIGLPHPLQMSAGDKNAWGELFGDYEILPPFAQLTRPVQALTDAERRGISVVRYTSAGLEPVVFGSVLQSRGWMRGPVQDGGSILEHVKYFPSADLTAVLSHSTLIVGYVDIGEKVQPEKLYFVKGYCRGEWGEAEDSKKLPLGELDAVVISEVLTDLDYLASKEKK